MCDCFLHLAYSRTRIGQLNDKKRNEKYVRALEKKITGDSVCLCLSDGSLLGLAAAKLGAKKVRRARKNVRTSFWCHLTK